MALLGTFGEAEGTGSLTTGSRTTVSGSLITAGASAWASSATGGLPVSTDSKSNTYVEAGDIDCDAGANDARIELSYNANGTRGTLHTISNAFTSFVSNALGGQEWDNIEATPTVVTATATGTDASAEASVTVGAASTVIGMAGYNAADTSMAAGTGDTLAQNVDTNNSNQEHAVVYALAQTGSPQSDVTLGAAAPWGIIVASFTESGGAAAGHPAMRRWGGIPHMTHTGRGHW